MAVSKAEQILELVAMIAARRGGVSLEEICERFACSYRTAQRLITGLCVTFPELAGELAEDGRKRWRFETGSLDRLIRPRAEEIAALDLAVAHLDASGLAAEARNLRRLKDKVVAAIPNKLKARIETDHEALLEAQGFLARPGPRPLVDETVMELVTEAIKACRAIEVIYRSQRETDARPRNLAVYGLLYGSRRYLVGRPMEDLSGPVRKYRVDGLQSVRVTDVPFARPEGFDLQAFANRAFGVYESEAEYGEVVWRFVPDAAESARGYLFHPNQSMTLESDGSLVVRFKASGHLEMTWHLYCWGDKVEVLSPPKLRAMTETFRRSDFPAMP